jgi:hypothetical protein
MFVYEIIEGKAIPMNGGPKLKGKFTAPYVHWDGTSTPKERLGPPRGFRMSEYKKVNKSEKVAIKKPLAAIKLTKLEDLHINPDLFIPMQAGTIFDKIISTDGGILPATNVFAAGAPGVGKCVRGNTIIKIRNKKTGQILEMSIKEFHELNR